MSDFGLMNATAPGHPVALNLANNLDFSLQAAPLLKYTPDLAYAAAHRGGDVGNNAQGILGLHVINQVGKAIDQHLQDHPEFGKNLGVDTHSTLGYDTKSNLGYDNKPRGYGGPTNAKGGSGFWHNVENVGSGFVHGVENVAGSFDSVVQSLPGDVGDLSRNIYDHLNNTIGNPTWWRDNPFNGHGGLMELAVVKPGQEGGPVGTAKQLGNAAMQQFDNLQHQGRAIQLAYQREGMAGVVRVMLPTALAVAVATVAPEALAEAAPEAGAVGEDGLISGVGAQGAPEAAAAAPTAEEQAAKAAQDAATKPARAGEKIFTGKASPVKAITQGVKYGLRGINSITSSPQLLAAQLGPQFYSALGIDPTYTKIWNDSQNAKGFMSLGQELSSTLGLGKQSVLSGGVDGVVSLFEAPFMAGRAAATENGAKSMLGVTSDAVNKAFAYSPRYHAALTQMVGIVKDAPDEATAVGQISALFPDFAKGAFRDPAMVKSIIANAESPEELNHLFAQMADAMDAAHNFRLPTLGIYGKIKALKSSDKIVLRGISHVLAAAPFTVEGGKVAAKEITVGDPGSARMLGQLMRSRGILPSVADAAVGHLLLTGDELAWENTIKHELYMTGEQVFDKRTMQAALRGARMFRDDSFTILKKLSDGKALTEAEAAKAESLMEDFKKPYEAVRQAWHNQINEFVGGSWSKPGVYGNTVKGEGITNSAIWTTQTGKMALPRYQDLDTAFQKILANHKEVMSGAASLKDSLAHTGLATNDFINRYFNEMFFKPLALSTPGWAGRVSISEGMLNLFRLGPRNVVAGRVGQGLRKQTAKIADIADTVTARGVEETLGKSGYKVDRKVSETLALFARGMATGIDKSILTGLDKEDFIKNAVTLAYRHGAYLPSAWDSRHAGFARDTDVTSTRGASGLGDATTQKAETAKAKLNGEFHNAAQGTEGHLAGWLEQSHLVATDEHIGRPLARAYLRLYDQGLRGSELTHAAEGEAQKIIENLPSSVKQTLERSYHSDKYLHPDMDPALSHAKVAVSALEGLVSSSSGYFNKRLLMDISNNEVAKTLNEFDARYLVNADGERLATTDIPKMAPARGKASRMPNGPFASFAGVMQDKVLGPMVNYLVRQPLFVAEFSRERALLDVRVARGLLTADQADVIAETNAAQRSVRFIHNPADKTHFEEMMRTVAPFYFAQNQAFRRMGRLFAENPGAFGQYLASTLGVSRWVSSTVSKNGISLFNIPGSALFGMPFTASLSSLQTMDPLAAQTDTPGGTSSVWSQWKDMLTPKFGPVVTVPVELLTGIFPSLENYGAVRKTTDQLLGPIGASQSLETNLWTAAMPNSFVRNIADLVSGSGAFGLVKGTENQTLNNAYMQAKIEAYKSIILPASEKYWDSLPKNMAYAEKWNKLATWQADQFGRNGSGPHSITATLNDAAGRANVLFTAKVFAGAFAPVSIGVGEYGGNRFTDLVAKYVKKNGGDYLKGVEQAVHDNPWMVAGTVSKSTSTLGYVPETKSFFNWMDANRSLVETYGAAALAFGPTPNASAPFYEPAHQLQINLGLRARQTPEDFANAVQVAIGNGLYYNAIKPAYEAAALAKVKGAYAQEQNAVTGYGQQYNPAWAKSHKEHAFSIDSWNHLSDLERMMNEQHDLPAKQVADYRDLSENWVPLLKQWQSKVGTTKGLTYQDITDWWTSQLADYQKTHPEAAPGINAIFLNLG